MKDLFSTMDTSDIIQLFGILVSLLTSIVAIIISLVTARQNSKMIEDASKPMISVYVDTITICEQTSYFVIKNFGSSPAKITDFKYDPILKETKQRFPLLCTQFDYVKDIILAPGQSKLLEYNLAKLPVDNVHFSIKYSSGSATYSEDVSLNVKNYIHLPVVRKSSNIAPGNEREVQTLREMLERSI